MTVEIGVALLLFFSQSIAQLSPFPTCISLCESFPCDNNNFPKDSCLAQGGKYGFSGLVWHERLQQLIGVDDDGQLLFIDVATNRLVDRMDVRVADYGVNGQPGLVDAEALAIADMSSDIIFIGCERFCRPVNCQCSTPCSTILEFDFVQRRVLREIDVSQQINDPDDKVNHGLEALAWVADVASAPGAPFGSFLIGVQDTGRIRHYRIDQNSTSLRKLSDSFRLARGEDGDHIDDLSDMFYDQQTNLIFALYAQHAVLSIGRLDCLLQSFELPELGQGAYEGIGVRHVDNDVIVYIGDDGGGKKSGGVFPFNFTCIVKQLPTECAKKGVLAPMTAVPECVSQTMTTDGSTLRVRWNVIAAFIAVARMTAAL